MDDSLLDVNEVANLLNVSATTVWRMKKDGGLPFVRIKGAVRFEVEAVRRYVEANRVRPGD